MAVLVSVPLMLMFAFATLVLRIIDNDENKIKPIYNP